MSSPKKQNKMNSLINKTKLALNLFSKAEKHTLKDFFNERLEKLFDSAPSKFGYKTDIESLLNDLGITKEQLLQMTINSLSKTVRNKQEIKTIASYLFFMQDFLKLIKAKGVSEKETILLKDLLTLSEAMIYEKQQKDTVMMRYGEKGSTAYILLNGQVDVLIETSFFKNMGEKTYLYYLANLIKYHEFGLVNLTVNDNFKKFPIEIIDDITKKTIIFANNDKSNNINNNIDNNNIENSITNYNYDKKISKDLNQKNKFNLNELSIQNMNNNNFFYKVNSSNNYTNIRNEKTRRETKRQKIEGEDNNEKSSLNTKNEARKETQQKGFFRLNFMNEEIKDIIKVKKYRARELLDMFGLKLLDKKYNKKLNHCNTNEYIQRLNIFEYLEKKQHELEEKKKLKNEKNIFKINKNNNLNNLIENNNKKNNFNEEKKEKLIKIKENKINNSPRKSNKAKGNNNNNEIVNGDDWSEEINKNNQSSSSSSSSFIFEMNHNMIFDLKIFTYMKVVTLGVGSLFGEMALNDSNALRKAAIITSSDCHFSVLNKKTFNNCIKMGAQKHLRELLQFFIELPIFSGIPEGVFYHKYYTNLSKFTIVKGKTIINQGEKPEYITLLQSGSYGVTTHMSLYDLTRLIFKYAKYYNINNDFPNEGKKNNNKENNISKINDYKNKYRILFQNVINIMNEENMLLNDNIIFNKYYYSQQFIRIAEISCPEVIINEEYMDENGLFAFSIEAKAPENIIYTLNNKFYIDLKTKNISVKKNQDKLLSKKINVMIQRLLIIRNSLINSFFDYKSRNEVGSSVIRELEEMIIMQLKRKRSLVKKDEKIIITNENEIKEKKEKALLVNININSNGSNSYLVRKKINEFNKYYKDTCSSLLENNSYSNNLKFDKKNTTSFKINQDLEKIKKIPNKINKNIFNKKMNSFKYTKNKNIKFNNNYLNMYKKVLSSSPNKKLNITNKDLNVANKLPFKDNEEDILFSLYEKNNTDRKFSLSNYNINIKMSNTNSNMSRNKKNDFSLMRNKIENKTIFNSYGNKNEERKENYTIFHNAQKVIINNLIWENIKSVMKLPIHHKLKEFNSNKTANNFHKNTKLNKSNLFKYLENNLKCLTNRNENRLSLNSKTEENKFNKANNNKKNRNKSLSKELSFANIKINNINNIYLLSSPSKLKNYYLSTINNDNKNNKKKEKENENQILLNSNTKNNFKGLPKIKIKLKKFYSPQEVNFIRMNRKRRFVMDGNKYNRIKGEKFKSNRNDYYKKNLINRMNYFYGYSPD